MGAVGLGIRPLAKRGSIGEWKCLQGPYLVGGKGRWVGRGAAASLQLVVRRAITLGLSCK